MAKHLNGQRILVLEDEYLAALEVRRMVEQQGGKVIGPVGRLDRARDLARSERLDAAILDVKMNGDFSFTFADKLLSEGVPVIFATGYDIRRLPARFADTPTLTKPFTAKALEQTLKELFAAA